MLTNPILSLSKITKRYPGVVALKNASLDLLPGEVHAIIGENGAGKSTLVKIMTGVIQPTEGEIFLDGEPIRWGSAHQAIQKGVAAIYQEPATFPDLNVAENIFIGHQPRKGILRRINWQEVYSRTRDLLDELESSIRPTDKIDGLSFAESQLVEIAKALSVNARIVIMDEPTSALSMAESNRLFEVVLKLKSDGVSIVFISHRLNDIFRVADRVTTLRDGEVIGTRATDEVDRSELIRMMVGRSVDNLFPRTERKPGPEILRVENLCKRGLYKNISFSARAGEILGLYGLIGAGRSEVLKTVFGLYSADSGQVYLDDVRVKITSPGSAIDTGIAYLSEDRDLEGIVLDLPISENVTLANLMGFSNGPWIDRRAERSEGKKQIQKLKIKALDEQQLVVSLSGGNKQKVSLAKWLAGNARVLILDEPTKGIDVAAKASVHQLIDDLAHQGIAIIMISSDLPEILGMSDRIIVMHEGLIRGSFSVDEADEEQILALALTEIGGATTKGGKEIE